MQLLIVSFIGGFLTVLAPCTLFILPTLVIGSASENKLRPWLITGALGFSVFLFSIVVKSSSLAVSIPDYVWSYVSGILLLVFGISLLFPRLWELFAEFSGLNSTRSLIRNRDGNWGAILMGAALGPVFTTCSPTFALLIAIILPNSFWVGFINILVFVLGMMIPFLLIALIGQKSMLALRFLANPHGIFKRSLGVILIVVSLIIMTGFQKNIENYLLDKGIFGEIKFEKNLLEEAMNQN